MPKREEVYKFYKLHELISFISFAFLNYKGVFLSQMTFKY